MYCVLSCFSCVWLFATLWTVAHQSPLSMGFFRKECWSGLPCPSPGDLPNRGTELASPALQAVSYITGELFTNRATWEAPFIPVCLCAKSLQLYLTLCNPMDCSLPGSSVHGIFQARILKWVAKPSFMGSFWPKDLPDPAIKPMSLAPPALPGRFFTTSTTWKAHQKHRCT